MWIKLPPNRAFVIGYWIDEKGKIHYYRYREYRIIKETEDSTLIEFRDGKRIIARLK